MRRFFHFMLCFVIYFSILPMFSPIVNAAAEESTASEQQVPAFPGAEGFGKYTTGGRGGEVYIVTNVNDSGPGSLRDAVSESNRTVVFEVSGNILLDSPLYIQGDNITIAGQTAPGDGITVTNHSTYIEGNNIIIRYMRFRMGDRTESTADAFSARNRSDLIVDHSSMSWGVDEIASAYDMRNVTIQNSMISEALHMTDHDKGRHGFGGIWGSHSSYLNNIIAHNSSRNPRFKGTLDNDKGYDFRNNIIYNWNYYAGYGGNEADVNVVNNYYKYGPDTRMDKRAQMIELPEGNSNWYIDGNFVYDFPEVTEDNMLGIVEHPTANVLDEPVDVPEATTRTALEAFDYVLQNAGATLPRRDSIDARIVDSIHNGTGRQINSIDEVGGWADFRSAEAPADSNRDGIPDDWAEQQGVDPMDDTWANQVTEEGYTNLEVYLNSIVSDGHHNPEIAITSPSINDIYEAGETVTINAESSVENAEIDKVVFYNGTEVLGEVTSAPYEWNWSDVPEGTHFVFVKAYSSEGRQTDSQVIPIHANITNDIAPWSSADIGETGIPGHSAIVDGTYVVKGDGNVTADQDSHHFMYQKVSGDIEITAQILSDTKVAPHNREGVMIRESLDVGSPLAMSGISVRGEDRVGVFYHRQEEGRAVDETDPIVGPTTPYWVRLTKIGDVVTGYISEDGTQWQLVSSMKFPDVDEVYVGLAVDAANEGNLISNLNRVAFDNVTVEQLPPVPLYPKEFSIARGEEALYLEWSEAERATEYLVERSTVKDGPYETIATVADAVYYTDTNLEEDVNYFYVIRAANEYGDSSLTSEERNGALLSDEPLYTRLLDADFEDQAVGTRPPDGFEGRPDTDNNYAAVVDVPMSSSGNSSDQAVMLYDDSSSHTYLTRNFEPQTGKMVVETEYMQEEMSTFGRAIRVMDGGRNNVEIFTGNGRGCEYEYCWYFRYQGDAALIPENNRFSLNEWYHVRIEIDVPAQEFSLYINGEHSGTLPFQGSASQLNQFESHTWGTSEQYLDDIQISSASLEAPQAVQAVKENESTVPIRWDAVENADHYNVYRRWNGDRYHLIAAELSSLEFTDEVEGDGTYIYAVAAYNSGSGEGSYSEPVEVIVDERAPTITITNESDHPGNEFDDMATAGEYTITGSLNEAGTVWIEGQEWTVEEDQTFSAVVSLRRGRNRIEINAADLAGNEADPVVWEVVAVSDNAPAEG
ncbi:hypothetical protein GI584_22735 [Gracilibacillus salitolerans]|uniref:Fibronectin type-III domain-containing protein n=1 Tax=Gracilibacillus salitolerans TaxID=2663022 RepID=A0A5Q2TRH4_9BACI|nr:Ig-like domain-containing protein [Gracilibacillus salitolerans]QGH36697.1 hypothetical protein GI584_22735 [Gracilibacillus salitolerans]